MKDLLNELTDSITKEIGIQWSSEKDITDDEQPILPSQLYILGTMYDLIETTDKIEPRLKGCDGYHSMFSNEIIIEKHLMPEAVGGNVEERRTNLRKHVLRHEIMHAYFSRAGWRHYRDDEPLIDLLATHLPEIFKTLMEVDAL